MDSENRIHTNSLRIKNGDKIAVMGGGPAGSFFSYFFLDLANRMDLDITLDIYEPQYFNRQGPTGCNHCGGIVSESLVQHLASEGVNIPEAVIRGGIDSYIMHTDAGDTKIGTPIDEKRIAAMYRGAGPLKSVGLESGSFDGFLLGLCLNSGANVIHDRISALSYEEAFPVITTKNGDSKRYDLLVGAPGLNPGALKLFKELGFGFTPPGTAKTYITEFELGENIVQQYIGNSMHVFLMDIPGLHFGALIPKGPYVTLALLGEKIDSELVDAFISSPQIKQCFPDDIDLSKIHPCKCFPKINVVRAKQPFGDRIVLVGDAAASKLYKNGIGAAYLTSKSAATAVLMHGYDKQSLRKQYEPTCKSLNSDNRIGRLVFFVTHIIQKRLFLKKALIRMVHAEQSIEGHRRHLSTVLWDTFTGSASYSEIFKRTLNPVFLLKLSWNAVLGLLPLKVPSGYDTHNRNTQALGHLFNPGEIIVKEGEWGDTLHVIQSGMVEVVKDQDGKTVHLADLVEGEFFGEMAIFEKGVRSGTVRAKSFARVLTIDSHTLMHRIQDDPTLAFKILNKMSARIRETDEQLSKIKGGDRRNWDERPSNYSN